MGGYSKDKRPYYIQWTTDFDCGFDTNWWYCIKDTPFDLNALKAKRRYEVNKGLKNFQVSEINPKDYLNQINCIRERLFAQYPVEYRNPNNAKNVEKAYQLENKNRVSLGAFQGEQLCGYLDVEIREGYIDFTRMCVDPEFEKQNINFALVYALVMRFSKEIQNGIYICDGSRTIKHKTSFQEWLIKYFGFRKAYCRLHIECVWWLKVVLILLRPFEKLIGKSQNKKIYNIYCFMKMHDIANKV